VNWLFTIDQASGKFEKKMDVADRQKQLMIDAGFMDVQDDIYKVRAPAPHHTPNGLFQPVRD